MGDGIQPAISADSVLMEEPHQQQQHYATHDINPTPALLTTTTTAAPREHLINTAIKFLQNAAVKRNPLNHKQQYLRSKGLTEDEIQIACERAGVFTGISTPAAAATGSTVINMGISAQRPSSCQPHHLHAVAVAGNKTLLQHVRDVASATALLAGVAYAIYMFYKKFIRPLLFGRGGDTDGTSGGSGPSSATTSSATAASAAGRKRRRKTPEELMEDMSRSVEKSVASINQELSRVREEVARTARQDALHREIGAFKADLDAIKGLLLNRKQFSSPVVPPSIPAWQLQVQQQLQQQQQQQEQSVAVQQTVAATGAELQHRDEDIASGSGSSETEVVNKNSDSSIELI